MNSHSQKVKLKVIFVLLNSENIYCHVKVLLKKFYLNDHIAGFHTQTQTLELCTK